MQINELFNNPIRNIKVKYKDLVYDLHDLILKKGDFFKGLFSYKSDINEIDITDNIIDIIPTYQNSIDDEYIVECIFKSLYNKKIIYKYDINMGTLQALTILINFFGLHIYSIICLAEDYKHWVKFFNINIFRNYTKIERYQVGEFFHEQYKIIDDTTDLTSKFSLILQLCTFLSTHMVGVLMEPLFQRHLLHCLDIWIHELSSLDENSILLLCIYKNILKSEDFPIE